MLPAIHKSVIIGLIVQCFLHYPMDYIVQDSLAAKQRIDTAGARCTFSILLFRSVALDTRPVNIHTHSITHSGNKAWTVVGLSMSG